MKTLGLSTPSYCDDSIPLQHLQYIKHSPVQTAQEINKHVPSYSTLKQTCNTDGAGTTIPIYRWENWGNGLLKAMSLAPIGFQTRLPVIVLSAFHCFMMPLEAIT